MKVDKFPDRLITVQGKPYLYFGGTSYLGLATHKKFQTSIVEGIKKWGTFYGSSRNANVKLSIYNQAERAFASWIETEVAVTVSSGALAGKLVLDYFDQLGSTFFHYPKTHTAIKAKNSLPLFINGTLHPKLLDNKKDHVVIAMDAVLALDVNATSLEFLETIPNTKEISLLIDESHSIGLLGLYGQGIYSSIPLKGISQKIMVASIGKALGLSGGLIGGDTNIVNAIKKQEAFISSSGANPAYLQAFISCQDLYESQMDKLKSNMIVLFSLLNKEITEVHNINYPVLYFQGKKIYKELLEKGIIITSFEYPNYNEPMNRVVITSNHKKEDLKILATVLNQMIKKTL